METKTNGRKNQSIGKDWKEEDWNCTDCSDDGLRFQQSAGFGLAFFFLSRVIQLGLITFFLSFDTISSNLLSISVPSHFFFFFFLFLFFSLVVLFA